MEQLTGANALEYAGFWRRFAAFIIDAVLLIVIIRILFPFRGLWFDFSHLARAWYYYPLVVTSSALSSLLAVAYSAVFWAWRGQTPGKIVMNIKVLRSDGANISLSYALLRFLGYLVCVLMLGTGFLWIAFDSRKQGIHDKIADTVVVKLLEPTRTQHAMATPGPSAG